MTCMTTVNTPNIVIIGLLESSHWALSFQPPTFKKFQKLTEKKIIEIEHGATMRGFQDAPDKIVGMSKDIRFVLVVVNGWLDNYKATVFTTFPCYY